MSATKWKTKGRIRPYAPRNWALSHVALCNPECEVEPVTFPGPDEVIAMDAEPAVLASAFADQHLDGVDGRHDDSPWVPRRP